jgi:hypothetical protein
MSDCCALLSPLNCAGWPLLTATLDALTEFVLEVDFFNVPLLVFIDVVLLIFFDVVLLIIFGVAVLLIFFVVDTGFEEVEVFLELVELGLLVLVVFFELVLTFSVLVGFLLVEVSFLVLDDF